MVADGRYTARITVLDDMTEEWDFDVDVDVLGFRDRTRSPIRVEISGSESADRAPERRKDER